MRGLGRRLWFVRYEEFGDGFRFCCVFDIGF